MTFQQQLVDTVQLNPHINAFQRHYVAEVKRTDEMLRTLRSFSKHVEKYNMEALMEKQPLIPVDTEGPPPPPVPVAELHNSFSQLEKQLQNMIPHQEMLTRNHVQLAEFRHTLDFVEVGLVNFSIFI
jgi:V-type H+-transporting ATPase subunit a